MSRQCFEVIEVSNKIGADSKGDYYSEIWIGYFVFFFFLFELETE